MIKGMTGFGRREAEGKPFGKILVELRSSNHKFLDIVLHLPGGFLSLEDRIKKEIESRIKRGRVTCAVVIGASGASRVEINKALLHNYLVALQDIKKDFHLKGEISLDNLMQLPGVLGLAESAVSPEKIWPKLKVVVRAALVGLEHMRQKEGEALYRHLKRRALILAGCLDSAQERFDSVVKQRLARLTSDEEQSSFLKDSDIAEELERLNFHIKTFKSKITQSGSIGKELDFISQEMQREANTMAAKSCDKLISAKMIQIKSQIEKIREQLQNIE